MKKIYIYAFKIQSCDACQRNNHKLQKTSESLHPIPIKAQVWSQLGMDLIGPLRETSGGFKYIITVIDYYSKWAEAGPLKELQHRYLNFCIGLVS